MEWISGLPESHLGMALLIVLLSYLLEDLAIITSALLAADNQITLPLALLAIFIGIASGDIGLYVLGMLARRWRGLRYRLLSHKRMRQIRAKLIRRPFANIAVIRFVPGLRTLGFTLSGLFRIQFYQFFLSVLIATSAWVAVVFLSVYQLGTADWLENSPWKWVIAPFALALLWQLNRSTSNSPQSGGNVH